MGVVPESVIREIRDRTDLVELVGAYVPLRRSGRGCTGLCPVHQEKTPSFHVNPDRGIYHCFGCGVTGDAYKFLMEHDHLSFPEALEQLAQRAGIPITLGPAEKSQAGEYDRLYRAHEIAARLYRETLEGAEGKAAREEIARRGFSPEVVRDYRVGAAPAAWDRLVGLARREGLGADVLEKAGLAIPRESGSGHYDRFRDRLMFPIEVMGPRVVGFGGRVLGEAEPKYLNSPETLLFRKRKTLYGLPQASSALRDAREAILVEGYMDVLALASAGFENAVGALGTAFGAEHAQVLARVVDRVFVVFDGDAAGTKAMLASAAPLLGAGLDVRVVRMPEGEDPDSLIRKSGAAAFERAKAASRGVVDALLGDEVYEGGAGRDRAVRRALSSLAELDDPLRRRVYVQEIAERTGIPAEILDSRLAASAAREAPRRERSQPDASRARPRSAAPARCGDLDRKYIGLVLQGDELALSLLEEFDASHFADPVVRSVVLAMHELASAGIAPSAAELLRALEASEEAAELVGDVAAREEAALNREKSHFNCRALLHVRALQLESKSVLQEVRRAKAQNEESRIGALSARLAEIQNRIHALKESISDYDAQAAKGA